MECAEAAEEPLECDGAGGLPSVVSVSALVEDISRASLDEEEVSITSQVEEEKVSTSLEVE